MPRVRLGTQVLVVPWHDPVRMAEEILLLDHVSGGRALIVGDTPAWRLDPMPYGGVKDSGLGREGIRSALEEMTEPRMLVMSGLS